jgi:hypothetical protein
METVTEETSEQMMGGPAKPEGVAKRKTSLTSLTERDPMDIYLRPRTRRTSREEHTDFNASLIMGSFDTESQDDDYFEESTGSETGEPDSRAPFTKTVMSNGKGVACPRDGATCKVKIVLVDPVLALDIVEGIASFRLDQETDYQIGHGVTFLTEAVDRCLLTMKQQEICELRIKYDPEMEHQNFNLNLHIDGKSSFTFLLELKSFEVVPAFWELNAEKLFERGNGFKSKGTELFGKENIEGAFKMYSKCMKLLIMMGREKELDTALASSMRSLKVQCYLNLTACQMKCDNHQSVIKNCTKALEIDEKNVKGLYRRGWAYAQINDLDSAKADLSLAVRIDPSSKPVARELEKVNQRISKVEKEMARGMRKMFTS